MSLIETIHGLMEESLLRKTIGEVDNETEHTTWVEYCGPDCDGPAHRTHRPDAPECFCRRHVHRSAHVTLKQAVEMGSAVGGFQ